MKDLHVYRGASHLHTVDLEGELYIAVAELALQEALRINSIEKVPNHTYIHILFIMLISVYLFFVTLMVRKFGAKKIVLLLLTEL